MKSRIQSAGIVLAILGAIFTAACLYRIESTLKTTHWLAGIAVVCFIAAAVLSNMKGE